MNKGRQRANGKVSRSEGGEKVVDSRKRNKKGNGNGRRKKKERTRKGEGGERE